MVYSIFTSYIVQRKEFEITFFFLNILFQLFNNYFIVESISNEWLNWQTFLKNLLHVEAISWTDFVVGTVFQISRHFSRLCVRYDPWAIFANWILSSHKEDRNILHVVSVNRHLGKVGVNGVETDFIFKTENEYDCVDPMGKLQNIWKK